MTSASMVPMVAVAVPRITVFLSASWVDDNSVNTNTMLCSVKVDGVTSVVAFGDNAALNRANYGRNTGLSSTTRQNASAAQRHFFISTRRRGGGGKFELWRILEQAPDFRRHGVEAGGQRQDRRRAEQGHGLQKRDQCAGDEGRERKGD